MAKPSVECGREATAIARCKIAGTAAVSRPALHRGFASASMDLRSKFNELKTKGKKALVLYVTAGDPALADLPEILAALEEGGADIIEIGIPFSDPIADGPVIQASTQRALEAGVNPKAVLEQVRKTTLNIPIVFMGYYNPILRMGPVAFAKEAKEAGISGTIITDLTPEESNAWTAA